MRRPITLLMVILLILVTTVAAALVSAQSETDEGSTFELPITEDVRYELGIGDTLDAIAATFDVELACLIDTNEITNTRSLTVGTRILIPVSCPVYVGELVVAFPRPVEQGGGGPLTYRVQVADTLEEIAFAFDVSLIALQEYNGITNARDVMVGDILEIPEGAPPYGTVPPLEGFSIEQGGGDGEILYTIQPGDVLDTIAALYDADTSCILEANGITNSRTIQPRVTIIIPATCPEYRGYNTIGGRVLPVDTEPTVVRTPQNTAIPTVAITAVPTVIPATPTPEQLATEEPTAIPTSTPATEPTVVETVVPSDDPEAPVDVIPTVSTDETTATPTPEVLTSEEETGGILGTLNSFGNALTGGS
jgi:LysM repeat protein